MPPRLRLLWHEVIRHQKLEASAHCAWGDHFVVGIPVLAIRLVAVLPLVGFCLCSWLDNVPPYCRGLSDFYLWFNLWCGL
jgi:hypothetical protein